MLQEHKKIIENSINDILTVQEKFSDFEINNNFQSFISQLDLFKLIASLVIGIIGIGYLYDSNLDKKFLLISLFFATITLVLSISYTREAVDLQPKLNQDTHLLIANKTKEHIDVALKALKQDNPDIFFKYAKEELNKKYPEAQLNYIGEIIIFLFYLSIGFLSLSFFSYKHPIEIISLFTFCVLVVSYLISFKNWAIFLSNKLSSSIFRRPSKG